MNFAVVLVVFCMVVSQLVAANSSPSVENHPEIKRNDGSVISYYLHSGAQNVASKVLIVYLQGSDCNSVKHDIFFIANAKKIFPLADLLMIDKLGISESLPFNSSPERPDCPAAYVNGDSPRQRVTDLNTVVSNILKRKKYDKVIAVGGSEGVVVAAIFAAESHLTDAVVLINGGGRWFLDDVLYNIEITANKDGVQAELDGFKEFAERITNGEPFQIEMSNHGYRWWRDVLTIDLQSVLERVSTPVLLIQGGKDESVSPKAVKSMVESLQKMGKENLEVIIYPDLNHGLSSLDGRYHGNEVFVDVGEWLMRMLQAKPDPIFH